MVAYVSDQSSLAHFTRLFSHKLPDACREQMHTLDAAGLAQHEPAVSGRFCGGLLLEGEGQFNMDSAGGAGA